MDNPFDSPAGRRVCAAAEELISEFDLRASVCRGVVLGFSGGADSTCLLLFLLRLRDLWEIPFDILAVHVHHGIRGEEADADADFCRRFCAERSVPFVLRRVDAPAVAAREHLTLEEAARKERYSVFNNIIRGRMPSAVLMTAHNATDNLETVLFRMMRGTGCTGLAGIAPVRGNLLRPLLYATAADIRETLNAAKIAYVTDGTNTDTAYARNYIRHEILPRLVPLNPSPERAVRTMTKNLRENNAFIEENTRLFLARISLENGKLRTPPLRECPPLLFAMAVTETVRQIGGPLPGQKHIDALRRRVLAGGEFRLCFPGNLTVDSHAAYTVFSRQPTAVHSLPSTPLQPGVNSFPAFGFDILVGEEYANKSYSNVYNFSIQQRLSFDIIDGKVVVRTRKAADSWFYRGMTHRFKKLCNDRHIPVSLRDRIPVIADATGVLWIPGFGVRGDGAVCQGGLLLTVAFRGETGEALAPFLCRSPRERKNINGTIDEKGLDSNT